MSMVLRAAGPDTSCHTSSTTGHAVVCVSVDDNGVPTSEISGNTNAAGSRLGNTLGRHTGDPTVVHHGIGPTNCWSTCNST